MRPPIALAAGTVLVAGAALRSLAVLGTAPVATLEEVGAGVPTLLYLFQPEDCPRLRRVVESWNEIHRSGRVRVIGVGLRFPRAPAERERLLRTSGAAFPLRTEPAARAERLALRLGYDRTPLAILLDARGRPRLALPPLPGPGGARRGARLVAEYAEALGGLPDAHVP